MNNILKIWRGKIFALVMAIVVIIFSIVCIIFSISNKNVYWQTELFLLGIVSLICTLLFTDRIDCTKEEICVRRMYFFKRHIEADRITTIQILIRKSEPTIVFCIDNHKLYKQTIIRRFFPNAPMLSRKVIHIRILEDECTHYIDSLNILYGNVILDESYIKWREIKMKKNSKL